MKEFVIKTMYSNGGVLSYIPAKKSTKIIVLTHDRAPQPKRDASNLI